MISRHRHIAPCKGQDQPVLQEADFAEHAKLAIWFGNAAKGLSDLALEKSEMCISIPIFGMVKSLNLATSSGILPYEVTKQRREYASRYRLRDKRGVRDIDLPTVMPAGD